MNDAPNHPLTPATSAAKIVAGAAGYCVLTFTLAYTWHLVLFKTTYDHLGYISREEPIIAFGFAAILLQGIILAAVYPLVTRGRSAGSGLLAFVLAMGGYHWTAHVLAAAAKQAIEPLPTWFAIETIYLTIQFTLGGCWLAIVYRR